MWVEGYFLRMKSGEVVFVWNCWDLDIDLEVGNIVCFWGGICWIRIKGEFDIV